MGQVFSFGSTEQPTMQQPRLQSAAPASIASTARSSPLPSYLKAEEQEIMARFIDQYFPPAAGAKRKRAGHEQAKNPTQPFGALSPLIQSLPFPPGGLSGSPCVPTAMNQVPSAPSNLDPTWQFNGFQTALPSFQPPPEAQLEPPPRPQPLTARGKGKQRAARIEDVVGDLSSSSSGSIRSLPLSSREGSVYSANSQRRVFQTGSTRLWHTQGRSIKSFTIEHIEIRRNDRVSGEGIAVVCRTESGQDVVDDLWMASSGMNSTPFIENSDIANEYQRREKSAKFVVSFAPNPKHHPQYSFSTKEDCWDFVQAITDKILLASIDVESIKSACTHGNSVETSCQTVQIWDDSMFSLRTVRFFRNKNENAQPRIVELNVNEFRCPDDGKRSGKLTVWLRDALEGPGKDLKYLKIVFSSGDQEEEFLQLVGFGIPNMSL
ncbi:hypothetical protein EJ08DRAFT_680069 [Tothia fuscella]|uniref:Uncharacterized protein n=1 Tax=Tothia fuscella TaxID=1048955 RepID=A0A9P4TXJ7_9PEZI|nr:hypothetical protein EJ08DRAFT_680069 [Tothia fuscella]